MSNVTLMGIFDFGNQGKVKIVTLVFEEMQVIVIDSIS